MAIDVKRSMLDTSKYEWQAGEGDDKHSIKHDAVMFNRKQGYEVVRMIQKICKAKGFDSVEDVKRVAEVIATELPGNVRSQKNVQAWLLEYFDTH
ncbi:MAG: hypothetical protein R3C44_18045 [Chloroflexota bacterium]